MEVMEFRNDGSGSRVALFIGRGEVKRDWKDVGSVEWSQFGKALSRF